MYELSNIYHNKKALSRSITAENPNGAKAGGAQETPDADSHARHLGEGWKVRPCIQIKAGETVVLADVAGPGLITHIWTTSIAAYYRDLIVRIYWDEEEQPSVEVPYGDFFCNGWGSRAHVRSMAINVNPSGGFNSYWPMPFCRRAKITVENQHAVDVQGFFYQIDYTLEDVPDDCLYFHAAWRRQNPLPLGEVFTVVEGVQGKGRFAGMYLAWGQNNNGWWGEGEVKFYLDGDSDYPTICGTGTEDYFGGAWGFVTADNTDYETYTAPYLGYHQLIRPDGFNVANMRHGMYRWHIMDPIHFDQDLRVTIQALGWRNEVGGKREFLPLQDDIAAVAYWYQTEPHQPHPPLADKRYREVI